MKIYNDPAANLATNPIPAGSSSNHTLSNNGVTFTGALTAGTNALGGASFYRATSTAGGTLPTASYFSWFYDDNTIVFKPGDVFSFSVYVRPSAAINLRVVQEGRHGGTGINNGFGATNASASNTACAPGVWTLLSNTATVVSQARSDGTIRLRLYLAQGTVGMSIPAGFTLDISNLVVSRGASVPTYFDGNSVGCDWVASPNASVSVTNSNLQWYTPTIYAAETVYNEVLNPRFANGTTLAPFWAQHSTGTTAGSFTKAANNQTITVTSLSAGGQFGVYATASDGVTDLIPLQNMVPSGSYMFDSIGVSSIASKDPATDLKYIIEYYASNGTTLVGNRSSGAYSSGGLLTGSVTLTGDAYYVKYRVFITAASAFSGTSSVTVANPVGIESIGFGYGSSISGDGVFTGASGGSFRFGNPRWLGTADASKSAAEMRIGKEVTTGIKYWDGSTWQVA